MVMVSFHCLFYPTALADVTCAEPALTNATIKDTDRRNPYRFGNEINIVCNSGYEFKPQSGFTKLTCQSTGQWDKSPAECKYRMELLLDVCIYKA